MRATGSLFIKPLVQTFFVHFTGGGRRLVKPLVHPHFQPQGSLKIYYGVQIMQCHLLTGGGSSVLETALGLGRRVGQKREDEGCPQLCV